MSSIRYNINKINSQSDIGKQIGVKDLSLDDKMQSLQNNMLTRCEREVPEYGDFAPVKETFKNTDEDVYAGNVGLLCTPSADKDPKKRALHYIQSNPQDAKTLASLICVGSKDDIMNALKNEQLIDELSDDNKRISQKLKDHDYNQSI